MAPSGLFHLFISQTVRILGVFLVTSPVMMRERSLAQRAAAAPRRRCRADAARDYVAAVMVTWALASVGGAGKAGKAVLTGEMCPLPPRSYYTLLPVVLLPGNRHCLK